MDAAEKRRLAGLFADGAACVVAAGVFVNVFPAFAPRVGFWLGLVAAVLMAGGLGLMTQPALLCGACAVGLSD